MLTEGQHIKVMDFGLATRLSTAADSGDGCDAGERTGRHERAAAALPPTWRPSRFVGRRQTADPTFFRSVFCCMNCSQGPIRSCASSISATLAAIMNEPIVELHDRMPAIPHAVGAVVAQMLAKDPAARYQSFGDVRRDLRRLAVELAAPRTPPRQLSSIGRMSEACANSIGRETERSQLLQAIELATSRCGSVVLLSGEAGIGKTRLAEEALNAARRLGCQTLVGRCYEEEGTPPLTPFMAVLEEASRLMPAPSFHQAMEPCAPELAKLLPELHRLFPNMAPPLELPPALRQRFLFTNFLEFLTRCGRFAPLVVFLDDLQWADESTLQLTQHLAQRLPTLPIVIIAAYRDIEVPTPAAKGRLQHLLDRVRGQTRRALTPQAFKASLDRLVRQRQARTIVLRPFTETEVRGMLTALGSDDPPSRLVRKIRRSHRRESVFRRRAVSSPERRRAAVRRAAKVEARCRVRRASTFPIGARRSRAEVAARLERDAESVESGRGHRPSLRAGPARSRGRRRQRDADFGARRSGARPPPERPLRTAGRDVALCAPVDLSDADRRDAAAAAAAAASAGGEARWRGSTHLRASTLLRSRTTCTVPAAWRMPPGPRGR